MSRINLSRLPIIPTGALLAIGSAVLFGASTPFAKLLLGNGVSPWLLAGLLYLGSGLGLGALHFGRVLAGLPRAEASLARRDVPWLALIILFGGVIGPLLLMIGLATTPASSAALLLNLEGLATMAIAWIVFRENVDTRLLIGAFAILAGALLLSWQGRASGFGLGALAIAGACLAWGVDNNLTRKLSSADPMQIAMIKGLVSGVVNLALAIAIGAQFPAVAAIAGAGLIGFLGYGISLVLFVLGLRHLGSARTGAYFSTAPFIGAVLGLVMFHEPFTARLVLAGGLMAVGLYLHLAAVELMATNGPLARTVADIRLALEAMSANGWDDPAWTPAPIALPPLPKPIRVALVVDDGLPMHGVTKESVRRAGRHLKDAGYEVEEINPPALDRVFTLSERINSRTGVGHLISQYLQMVNDEALTKFMTASGLLQRGSAAEKEDVLVERDQILRRWSQFFDRYPLIVMPVYTAPSMRANEDLEGPEVVQKFLQSARYLTGLPPLALPALALPVGEHDGLPHGVQIVARRWRDDLCLDAADEIQKREGARPVVDPKT